MSFPDTYLNERNALDREIQKNQPNDVLQFCANFFNKRLEAQRAEFLLSTSNNATGSSASAFGNFNTLSGGKASPGFTGGGSAFPGFGASSGFGDGAGSPSALHTEIGPDTRID